NSATLRWTISNGSCGSTHDDITLTNYNTPTVSGAGPDQEQCGSGTFTLAGNTPAAGFGTGAWTVVGAANGAAGATPSAVNSQGTGITAGRSVTRRWTISNGVCTASTDDVVLTNSASPTVADAGPAALGQCSTSTFSMTANAASVGTGAWTVQSGSAAVT